MLHLSNYDFVFGALIMISAFLAMLRGGIVELLSLSTWFIALFVMRHYAKLIELYMPTVISNQLFRSLLTYIIAFLGVAIIISIIKAIFQKAINNLGLGSLNITLGAIFGIIRGVIISALLIILIEIFNLDTTHSWQHSVLSPILVPSVAVIINAIPNNIKGLNQSIASQAKHLISSAAR